MPYVLIFLLGVVVGTICAFLLFEGKRLRAAALKREQDTQAKRVQDAIQGIKEREQQLQEFAARLKTERESKEQELDQRTERLKAQQAEYESLAISYKELQDENLILKRDLQNIDVNVRKLQLDRELQQQRQEQLDQKSRELGSRYLKDNTKWIGSSLTQNNFASCKERLQKVVVWCRDIGFDISTKEEAALLADLREEYEKVVRAAFEREEQARIKNQIREEQQLQKEVDREIKQLERERAAIQAALDKALAEAKDQHSAEVDRLKARLAEAEAKSQRAVSQAQMTKAGYVYVISNLGSFGKDVFKIGMTRRLEPMDRVKELGDASVPFPFDVHMMISSNDAPSLENALHRTLHKMRINKCNLRKEFFKTDMEAIRQVVVEQHGEVEYIADAEALEYRQSITMSDEDQEFIESVYEKIEVGSKAVVDDD